MAAEYKTYPHLTSYTPWGYNENMVKKNQLISRLKRIEGQVRGLQRMVSEDKYCIDIITQASAVKEALSSVESLILENHITTHVAEQIKSGKTKKAAEELVKIYKLSQKK